MARECPSIPVPEDNFVNFQERVMFNGVCTNVTSSKECKDVNMLVLINPFGEGKISQMAIPILLKPNIMEFTLSFYIRIVVFLIRRM